MNQHLHGLSLKLVPFFFLSSSQFSCATCFCWPSSPATLPALPHPQPIPHVCECVSSCPCQAFASTRLCAAQCLNVLNLKWSSSSFVILYHAPKWNLILLFLTFIVCLHVYVIVPKTGKCPFGWKAGTHTIGEWVCLYVSYVCEFSFASSRDQASERLNEQEDHDTDAKRKSETKEWIRCLDWVDLVQRTKSDWLNALIYTLYYIISWYMCSIV